MKLKKFIEKLKQISEKYGEYVEVVMADDIPVVEPIFLKNDSSGKIIITDQK